MRSKLYVLAAAGVLLAFLFFFFSIPLKPIPATSHITAHTEEADAPDEAIAFEIQKTKDPATGKVPRERLETARKFQLQKFAKQQASGMQSPVPGVSWTERGPDNVGGRTRAIMYDRNDATRRKVWAGGVGGGLWYTNDITATDVVWNKVNDTFNNLAVTAIAQYENIIVFGTGEGWSNGDAIRGNGIWRSLNGGITWEQMPMTKNNPAFYYVQDLAFLLPVSGGCTPANVRVIASTRTAGVQCSLDTAKTWAKVLGAGVGGGAIDAGADLEQEYYYVWATLGAYGQGGGGIFRSCDGVNWDKVYQATADEERIDISIHYQLAFYMYAAVQHLQGGVRKIKKLMKTDGAYPPPSPPALPVFTNLNLPAWCDNGAANPDFTRGQGWYDLVIAVTPIFMNHDNAFVGGVDVHKTTNSGANWTQVSQWASGCGAIPLVHADIHNIIFRPDGLGGYLFNDMLVATDGGLYRSTDGGGSFTARNKTYNITQFYGCAIHPNNTNYFLAGAQDNGTRKFTTAGLNNTTNVFTQDHDGGFCHIDQNNDNIQITSFPFNNYLVSIDGGLNFAYKPRNNRGQFINPTDYDNAANILYCGDSLGQYYRWINPASTLDTAVVTVSTFNNAKITHVRVSNTVANRVYFGLDNGSIVQVDDANTGTNKTGVVIRAALGADRNVSSIAIQQGNENHMLVSYSNYGITSVYESFAGTGGSLNWIAVEGDLPDMPVRWAMFDPRNPDWAIIATELGIWSTDNLNSGSTDWEPTNNNFANTRVDMLEYRLSDGTLAAVTHGRGLFTTIIPAAAVPVTLMDFTGTLRNHHVELRWQTATEQQNKGFDIERSQDGSNFSKIGFIEGAGNSNSIRAYLFADKDIAQPLNYYRLRQIDLDNRFEYSRIILIKHPLPGRSDFTVLNNPFNNTLLLQFGNIPQSRGEIRVFDVGGRMVFQWNGELRPDSRLQLQLPARPAGGLYIVQAITNNKKYTTRVLRQ